MVLSPEPTRPHLKLEARAPGVVSFTWIAMGSRCGRERLGRDLEWRGGWTKLSSFTVRGQALLLSGQMTEGGKDEGRVLRTSGKRSAGGGAAPGRWQSRGAP